MNPLREGRRTVDAYRPLFEALMTFEPPVYLFGGFAEDALLHGSVVRPHEDVDVLVSRDALERQLENTRSIGFAFERPTALQEVSDFGKFYPAFESFLHPHHGIAGTDGDEVKHL